MLRHYAGCGLDGTSARHSKENARLQLLQRIPNGNEEEAKKYFDKDVTTVNQRFALFMGTFAKNLVSGLTSIYNSIVPDDFKLSDNTIKKIENFTLDGVTNSVNSLLDFSDE